VKKAVGARIKRIRESQDISRDDVADELEITNSAYAKIERGVTDVNVSRLESIAKILKVNVIDFFPDRKEHSLAVDPARQYGFATRHEVDELTQAIRLLREEIERLKNKIGETGKTPLKRKPKKKRNEKLNK